MKAIPLIFILLCATAVSPAQTKPSAPAKPAPAVPAAPKPPDTVQPKESVASLKLALALEKQKGVQDQAQALQQQAMQAIEPRMVPLRAEFQNQTKIATEEEQAVRRENGWGPDIVLDQNLTSPTFGQWIKSHGTDKK